MPNIETHQYEVCAVDYLISESYRSFPCEMYYYSLLSNASIFFLKTSGLVYILVL